MRISKTVSTKGEPVFYADPTGTHVAAPLALDDAAVDKAAEVLCLESPPFGYNDPVTWDRISKEWKKRYRQKAHAAITAYLTALGEGA